MEFEVHCAVCHGMDAKGHGLDAYNLEVAPPNLTSLAKNNEGVFPSDRIIDVIDGRAQIKSHGLREMPNWGKQYAVRAAEYFAGSPYDQEAFIRGRVLILVDYLRRIQQKKRSDKRRAKRARKEARWRANRGRMEDAMQQRPTCRRKWLSKQVEMSSLLTLNASDRAIGDFLVSRGVQCHPH